MTASGSAYHPGKTGLPDDLFCDNTGCAASARAQMAKKVAIVFMIAMIRKICDLGIADLQMIQKTL
jgi:hypothetical protein